MRTRTNEPSEHRAARSNVVDGPPVLPPEIKFNNDADVVSYLSTNGASFLYSHIRSHVMTITGQSPMGAFTLPPVLPQAVVERALQR